tara:strand:- start:210 stop:1421 length:1212 start_codon:yes stop_codon:yes gene_type:complete
MIEDKMMLCDMVSAALQNPKAGIAGFKNHAKSKSVCKFLNLEFVRMQRFYVSNELLEHAMLACFSKPKTILSAAGLAIPPYDNMWIEWDDKYRAELIAKYSDKYKMDYMIHVPIYGAGKGRTFSAIDEDVQYPERRLRGYHIKGVDAYGARATHFHGYMNCCDGRDDWREKISAWGYGFLCMNQHGLKCQPRDQEEFSFLEEYRTHAIGKDYCERYQSSQDLKALKDLITPVGHPMAPCNTKKEFLDNPTVKDPYKIDADAAKHCAKMHTGDYTLLMNILGFINYDLIVTSKDSPARTGRVNFANRTIPKKQYKVLSIELPKPRGKVVYERMFTGHGAPKCEHWRRGHWRRVKNKDGVISHRVWINAMKVGDPALGSIIHDYDLQAKKPQTIDLENTDPEGQA